MPKRRLILGILGLGILAALIVAFTRPREPSYDGRSLSQWLSGFDDWSPSSPSHAEAADAIRHMGTNSIPCLLARIRYQEPTWRRKFREALRSLNPSSWWWMHQAGGSIECARAQQAFIVLGEEAKPAVPELVRLMNDPTAPQIAKQAAEVLASLGIKDAFPPLMAVLTNPQHPARTVVAIHIPSFGTNARPAIPALVQCLQDTNAATALFATASLGALRLEPELVVPALAAHLRHLDLSNRRIAVRSLGDFGPQARPAVPDLLSVLLDPDPSLRRAVTNALLKIAPETITNAPPR
jgi:HEAT repeat protein